jgi:RNA recognition motif-containing protein
MSGKRKEAPEGDDSVAKKAKPELPPGYVCKVCGAVGDHAVYKCPHKIKKKHLAILADGTAISTKPTPDVVPEKVEQVVDSEEVSETSKNTLYISGLPFDITREEMVYYLSGKYPTNHEGTAKHAPLCDLGDGEINFKDVKLVMFDDNKKKCKGIAFVKFQNEEDLEKCLLASGQDLNGREIRIERVVKRPAPASSSTRSQNTDGPKQKKSKGCYRCGQQHDPSTCYNARICYRCGSTDHISTACPKKKQN